jgi:hypothetical protein
VRRVLTAFLACLAFLACGAEGDDFDEDAVRDRLLELGADGTEEQIVEAVDATRSICELDDGAREIAVSQMRDEGNGDGLDLVAAGCPDRLP